MHRRCMQDSISSQFSRCLGIRTKSIRVWLGLSVQETAIQIDRGYMSAYVGTKKPTTKANTLCRLHHGCKHGAATKCQCVMQTYCPTSHDKAADRGSARPSAAAAPKSRCRKVQAHCRHLLLCRRATSHPGLLILLPNLVSFHAHNKSAFHVHLVGTAKVSL